MHSPIHKRPRGFSLVELLAVVAIILVVLAILLPMVGHLKESSRFVTCRSKLRQIGIAFQTYMVEHNGNVPGSYNRAVGSADWQKEYMGREVMEPGVKAPWGNLPQGTLVPYLGVAKNQLREFYRCPSLIAGVRNAPWTGSNGYFDYTMLPGLCGARLSVISTKATLYNRYTYPTPLLVEEDPYFYLNNKYMDPGHSSADRMGSWHLSGSRTLFQGGSANYMAIDGSAQTLKSVDIKDRSGSSKGDRLLNLGPYAYDWDVMAPSGALAKPGNIGLSYGQWNSL